ncbi:Methyl-CpG-binding domain-containing protein 1 [Nymphaea thermarum]|nr:Methyl-CpG-binding domain-containing protein 1 [Nymphaea thermarum]
MEKEASERRSSKKAKRDENFNYTIGEFAVQCHKCFKWRLIPTKDEYETIRHNFIEDPWYCNKNPNVTCDDPGDLECDETRIWMIDKPNIPKPPAGFDRNIVLRKDYSKSDSFYATPTGKKVRAPAEVEKFLEANPGYRDAGVSVSSFNFSVPKLMDFNQKAANVTPDGSGKKK